MSALTRIRGFLAGDRQADRLVPRAGLLAWLLLLTSFAMAIICVFALAFSQASGRLAERWGSELAQSATLRISSPPDTREAVTARALEILNQTPGVAQARALNDAEQIALLEPWFGDSAGLEALPMPRLIEIVLTDEIDLDGLRLRIEGELDGAVLDDHGSWRTPLVRAARWLRGLGLLSVGLVALIMTAVLIIAARAQLSANAHVIAVLRQIGARDGYIAQAFVRRATLQSFAGALAGTIIGLLLIKLLPTVETGDFLTGLGFRGLEWLWCLLLPPASGLIAFAATRAAARATLQTLR